MVGKGIEEKPTGMEYSANRVEDNKTWTEKAAIRREKDGIGWWKGEGK